MLHSASGDCTLEGIGPGFNLDNLARMYTCDANPSKIVLGIGVKYTKDRIPAFPPEILGSLSPRSGRAGVLLEDKRIGRDVADLLEMSGQASDIADLEMEGLSIFPLGV